MADINQKFAEHVTSVSFHLSLSRGMVVTLVQIAQEEDGQAEVLGGLYRNRRMAIMALGGHSDAYVASHRALEARGLIELGAPERAPWGRDSTVMWQPTRLTEAGRLTLRLLEIAGLVAKVEAVQQQVA